MSKPRRISELSLTTNPTVSDSLVIVNGGQSKQTTIGNVGTTILSSNLPIVTSGATINGDLDVSGDVRVNSLISSSIIYESGSTQFGNTADDTHEFTGSLSVSGSISATDYSNIRISESQISDLQDYIQSGSTDTLTNKTITDFSNKVAADEVHVQVYNNSGVFMGSGTPVYLSGYNFIGTAAPTVAPADASSISTMPCIGLTNEVIGNGSFGEVVISGFLDSTNTSAFSNGDVLYVSESAGELTATPPTLNGTNVKQPVAVVLYAAGGGKLQVLSYGAQSNSYAVLETDNTFSGTQTINGSINISEVMNLSPQDPLPTGSVGELAVSGSSLYFYNGSWTLVV